MARLLAALTAAALLAGCGAAASEPVVGPSPIDVATPTGRPSEARFASPSATAAPSATPAPDGEPAPSDAAAPAGTAVPSGTSAPGTPAPPSTPPAPASPVPDGQPAPGTAEEAARVWVAALGAGDLDRAWAVLADASRQQVGGRPGFDAMASALAEGWGAWAFAPEVISSTTTLVSSGEGEAGTVTLAGTVSQEGTTERRGAVLGVRVLGGVAAVDPFTRPETSAEIEAPANGAAVPCDTELVAYVPAGTQVLQFSIDGFQMTPETEGADGDRQRASLELEDGMAAGDHVLTVAYVDAAGRIGGEAVTFTVPDGCG